MPIPDTRDPSDVTNPTYWFHRKQYGWGWGIPATWQGWVVLGAYLVLVIAPLLLSNTTGAVLSLVAIVVATPILIVIAIRKGEPPQWQWGRRRR